MQRKHLEGYCPQRLSLRDGGEGEAFTFSLHIFCLFFRLKTKVTFILLCRDTGNWIFIMSLYYSQRFWVLFFFFAIAGLLMGFGVRQRWGRAAAMETQWEGGTDKIWTEGGRVWDSSVVPDGEK